MAQSIAIQWLVILVLLQFIARVAIQSKSYRNSDRWLPAVPPGRWLSLNIEPDIAFDIKIICWLNIAQCTLANIAFDIKIICWLNIAQCTLQTAQCQSQCCRPLHFTGHKTSVV